MYRFVSRHHWVGNVGFLLKEVTRVAVGMVYQGAKWGTTKTKWKTGANETWKVMDWERASGWTGRYAVGRSSLMPATLLSQKKPRGGIRRILDRTTYRCQPCDETYDKTTVNHAATDDRPSHAMKHMWSHNGHFHHNARLVSLCSMVAYVVLSRNGEDSFNKLLSPYPEPGPDILRGGPNHGYSTSCEKKIDQSEQ